LVCQTETSGGRFSLFYALSEKSFAGGAASAVPPAPFMLKVTATFNGTAVLNFEITPL
jgi:hypothetical protein